MEIIINQRYKVISTKEIVTVLDFDDYYVYLEFEGQEKNIVTVSIIEFKYKYQKI